MRRCLALALTLGLPTGLAAQVRVIDHSQARMYMGEDVVLQGPVARVEHGRGGTILMYIGRAGPSASVIIEIPSQYASNFDNAREYEKKTIQVSGRLSAKSESGIGIDRSGSSDQAGTPYLTLEDPSRLKVVPPAPKKP